MIYAAILAGGLGSRMGNGSLPKQFIELGEKPLLVYTVDAFLRCEEIEHIVIAAPKGRLDYAESILAEAFGEEPRISVTPGGRSRLDSLVNSCVALAAQYDLTDTDILLTHDGARPFVSMATIRENIKKMDCYDCVTTAIPSIDTVLYSENGADVDAIPHRNTMFAVQTPQTFRLTELMATIRSLNEEEKESLTDGAKIYLLRGKSVGIAQGASENIKITEPKDLLFAEAFLKA